MPIYCDFCEQCGHEQEEFRSISAPQPEHCGRPMVRQLGTFVNAKTTRGGNLIFDVSNSKWKGSRKPKTISRGNGLGGRRKPPSMAKFIGEKIAARGFKP